MLEQLPKILEESRRQVERALNSPLKLRAQLSEIVYPNAKDGALFSSVVRGDCVLLGGDSALRDKSLKALPRGVDRQPSLISLRGSQSKDFSSQILESQNGFTEQAENKTTANLRILEEENRGESDNSTHANAEVYPLQIIKSYELLHTRLLKITLIKIKEA